MKLAIRIAVAAIFLAAAVPGAQAQDHGAVGIFVNYFRSGVTDNNFVGLGGRLGFNVHPNVQLEGEMAWDFSRAFTEGFTDTATGNVTLARTDFRILHGMIGPKFQTSGEAWKVFVTVKGGFINFRFDDRPATVGNFISSVESLRTDNVRGVLYPGGGIEVNAKFIGFRFDIGDEIYWRNGAQHNLRMAFGPHIRF